MAQADEFSIPRLATASVLEVKCEPMPAGSVPVKGYDFNAGIDYERLLQHFATTGCQATNFSLATEEINRMVCSSTRSSLLPGWLRAGAHGSCCCRLCSLVGASATNQ